ncbi:response regulator, partial [candidate division KSB1 bacterium]|nr:response regulator [candidate division KSB1 bacterium]
MRATFGLKAISDRAPHLLCFCPWRSDFMEANILIVEDNEDICLVIADNLRKAGHRVKTVFNGEDALSLLHKNIFDLMLLDIRLPNKDGMQVLKEAHEIDPDLLVVMITAHGT